MSKTDYTQLRNFRKKPLLFGYCRISTDEESQSLDYQREAIKKDYPKVEDHNIYEDIGTGFSFNDEYRPRWKILTSQLISGDTIIFYDFSRFSRNVEEGITAYKGLSAQGVHLVFLTQPELNNDYLIKAYETLQAVKDCLQEAHDTTERRIQRTVEAMAAAAKKGKKPGPKKNSHHKKSKEPICKRLIAKHSKGVKRAFPDLDICQGTHTEKECLQFLRGKEETKINRDTYFKYKREIIAELTEYTRSGKKPYWMKRRRTSRKKGKK